MTFPVPYVFYLSSYIYQLVGIAFFGLIWFPNSFDFFSFPLFRFRGFREVPFLFTVLSYLFSGCAFVVRIPVGCIAISKISFFGFSFGLAPFFLVCLFLCRGFSLISFFLGLILVLWFIFLFVLSVVCILFSLFNNFPHI